MPLALAAKEAWELTWGFVAETFGLVGPAPSVDEAVKP